MLMLVADARLLPATPAEWAGLAAGLSFAMSNVLVIKASRELPEMRAEMRTATLFGGAAVFGAIASLFEGSRLRRRAATSARPR